MDPRASTLATAFLDGRKLAAGPPVELRAALTPLTQAEQARALVIDDLSGDALEMFSGDDPRAGDVPAPVRGRPKLGVKPREVTLLPRHWDWLGQQPGGASAALRRLIEEALRDPVHQRRAMRDALHTAIRLLAADRADYEEALRALYAEDATAFRTAIKFWPADVRDYAAAKAEAYFPPRT